MLYDLLAAMITAKTARQWSGYTNREITEFVVIHSGVKVPPNADTAFCYRELICSGVLVLRVLTIVHEMLPADELQVKRNPGSVEISIACGERPRKKKCPQHEIRTLKNVNARHPVAFG